MYKLQAPDFHRGWSDATAVFRFLNEYAHAGRPIIGPRKATHAFDYKHGSTSNFSHYRYRGFGKREKPVDFG